MTFHRLTLKFHHLNVIMLRHMLYAKSCHVMSFIIYTVSLSRCSNATIGMYRTAYADNNGFAPQTLIWKDKILRRMVGLFR